MQNSSKLILLRHGQSAWNLKNRFTGWVDVPLSQEGMEEAKQAGKRIAHLHIDTVFTSTLIRAQMTAMIAMLEHSSKRMPILFHEGEGRFTEWAKIHDKRASEESIPIYQAWELNERYYGELQGLDKDEARKKFGMEQVKIWRRSFDAVPPNGESLKMTSERSIPYFKEKILPLLNHGKNILIIAHGNSLRSIVMFLDRLSNEEVLNLEIATGELLYYDFYGKEWKKGKVD